MTQDLPYAPSCENNKEPILQVLRRHFLSADCADPLRVLEIASGTGQHAVHFAQHLPDLHWQCTEMPEHLAGLNRRLQLAQLPNLPPALVLDVTQERWCIDAARYIFTANSLHIMSFESVRAFFRQAVPLLEAGGRLAVYGPFKYEGEFTTPSNAQFDDWLKARNPVSGVRDFEAVNALALDAGLDFVEDNAMPANNQMLVWEKALA